MPVLSAKQRARYEAPFEMNSPYRAMSGMRFTQNRRCVPPVRAEPQGGLPTITEPGNPARVWL